MTAEQKPSMQRLLALCLSLVLVLGLAACGGKKSMEGAGDEDQVGTVNEDDVTRLAGEEDGVAQADFDQAEKARRLAALPRGNTASGPGKKSSYTTKEADTLWKIAERKDIYGSGWLYPLIYKANKALIKDPNKLEAGLKLVIPRNVSKVEEEIAKEEAMTGQILDSSPLPGQAKPEVKVATKAPKKASGGKGWLWFLLLALVGAGVYFWRRMKKQQAAEESPEATA